ncbi:MAG: DUF502 domain-containing protein [Bacteroidia bacterium]|nr:DUF502 domain-containing protein [Bacteroidia bacterium]
MKTIARYFLQGILVIVPLAITALVLYRIFIWLRGLFASFDVVIHPYVDPVLFTLLAITAIVLIGVFASSLVANFILRATENVLENTPGVKLIYTPIKDILSAFIGNRKRFTHPVLVRLNDENDIYELGFMTQENLSEMGIEDGYVSVYFPASYAVSGRVVIVPRARVRELDVPAGDAMKFILSGGVSDIG